MKINELKSEYYALDELIDEQANLFDEETGEFLDNSKEITELANELKENRDGLIDFLADKITESKANEKMLADEIKRLQDRKKSLQTQQNGLYGTIDYVLEGEKAKTLHHTIYYQKTQSVEIIEESDIPPEYIDFTPKVNKTELKKALKAGDDIKGAILTEKIGMRIK